MAIQHEVTVSIEVEALRVFEAGIGAEDEAVDGVAFAGESDEPLPSSLGHDPLASASALASTALFRLEDAVLAIL